MKRYASTIIVGVLFTTSLFAAGTACYVAQSKNCCDILAPGLAYPRPNDPCPDQITSNPSVSYWRTANNGESGRKQRVSQSPGQSCTWDEYEVNSLGNCVVVYEDMTETCIPVVVAGASCTGGAPQ